jgi:hypothetical protein
MTRVVLLILVLLLLIDVGEDGCLGKATFVAPQLTPKFPSSLPCSIAPRKLIPGMYCRQMVGKYPACCDARR